MDKKTYEYISKQASDPIVERINCRRCGESFSLFQGDLDLMKKLIPKIGDKEFPIPKPKLCPNCKEQKKLIFRKERNYYKRTCDSCKKNIVSVVPSEYQGPVYCTDCWYGDNFDPSEYAINIDRERPLIDQLLEIQHKVPVLALSQGTTTENSAYTEHTEFAKDCYLCGAAVNVEKCLYSIGLSKVDNIVDAFYITDSSLVYEGTDIVSSTKVFFAQSVKNSSFVFFSDHVDNCNYVLLSSNIINGQYIYKNKSLGREKWQKKFEEIKRLMKTHLGIKQLQKEWQEVIEKTPHKALIKVNVENSVGNEITDSKELFMGFDSVDIDRGRYLAYSRSSEDVMHIYAAYPTTKKSYDCQSMGAGSSNCYFSIVPRGGSSNIYFSHRAIYNCENIFACVGAKNSMKNYILNKQYNKKERIKYTQKLIQKSINEGLRGEGLDQRMSFYPYNDTVAMDFYPIEKLIYPDGTEKLLKEGGNGVVYIEKPDQFLSPAILDLGGEEKIKIIWRISNNEINIPEGMETIAAKDLPNSIEDIDDEVLQKAIICEVSGRLFRVVPLELAFYRKHGIAFPRKHYDIRHDERLEKRAGRKLYLRKCDKCGVEMLSVYEKPLSPAKQDSSPHRGAYQTKVYCEKCYNKEIYG